MIAKELLVLYTDWSGIIALVDKFCNSNQNGIGYNVITNKYNKKLKTIQLVHAKNENEIVFCEFEFDDSHHQLSKITTDGKEKRILMLADFIHELDVETNKNENLFSYV